MSAFAAGACTAQLRALLGATVIEQGDSASVHAPIRRAAQRLMQFSPARASWPLRAAFFAHDALATGSDHLGDHRPARLSQLASLGEQAIWQDAAADGRARLIIGFAGRFWAPQQQLAQPDWPGFTHWQAPGTARVAWQFYLVPAGPDASTLHFSMLAAGTDGSGHRSLRAYLLACGWLSRRLRRGLCQAAARACAAG